MPGSPGGGDDPGTVEEGEDLFTEEEGVYTFTTDNTEYASGNGYTFWTLSGGSEETFTQFSAKVTKTSGNSEAGYGIVFCQGTTSDEYDEEKETMLIAMINTLGEYTVMEAVGGTAGYVVPWAESDHLIPGYGRENTIGVSLSEGTYTLSLNGHTVATFKDEDEPLHTGGASGFLVVVSPKENFPQTPVTVRFEEVE